MERKDLLQSPEYWITKIQHELYACAQKFMDERGFNRTQLAEYLGVSKGYVSQLMSMEYDHRLSKLVELSLAFGYVPDINFEPIADLLFCDTLDYDAPQWYFNGETFKPLSSPPHIITENINISDSVGVDIEPFKNCA